MQRFNDDINQNLNLEKSLPVRQEVEVKGRSQRVRETQKNVVFFFPKVFVRYGTGPSADALFALA